MSEESKVPDRAEIVSTVEAYVRHLGNHDVDRLVELFADHAVQHEPLGTASYRGVEEIRAFDTRNASMPFSVERVAPVTVSGAYAATALRIRLDGMPAFATVDLFEFDDNGKIVSLSVIPDAEALW